MIPPVLMIVLIIVAQTNPAVTMSLDRSSYSPGESVTITIQVNAAELNATWLWLYIDKPDGHNTYFAQLAPKSQTVSWKIPTDAAEGMYTVTVTWDHQYIQTGCVVQAQPIPEFPYSFAVLLVATFATVAVVRWKTSTRPRAAPNDSGAHLVR